MQVQNRLNGLVVVAAILYCTLALVSMILNAVDSPAIPLLWYVTPTHSLLRRAVLCLAVPCRALLCCAVPC